ncbi:MAG TPA: hypothetical protein VFQ20_01455 [Burkholderiaceae bacterium]|nr:hypothetical protein [Burkholderiaceae bacterium]
MSFLEELKRQAANSTVAEPDAADAEARARNARLAQGALRITHDYWKEMVEQLNVIRPASTARYLLDGRRPVEDLRSGNFRVVPVTRASHAGEVVYESLVLAWQVGNGRKTTIDKELPTEADRVRAALRQASIQMHESQRRDAATGRLLGTRFEFVADVAASIRVVPLPDTGRVRLVCSNLDQLERIEAEFPAVGMRLRQLDEIGRWIVGQPQRVLEYASAVRRFQA